MKLRSLLVCVPFVIACGSKAAPPQAPTAEPEPAVNASEPAATTTPTPTTTDAPSDLSTADKARTAIYEALKRGDSAAFKSMVTKRILDRQKDFDAYYAVWKSAADQGPEKFAKITVTEEAGQFKLDEN